MERIRGYMQIIGKGGFAREVATYYHEGYYRMFEFDEIETMPNTRTIIAISDIQTRIKLTKGGWMYGNCLAGEMLGRYEIGQGNIFCHGSILTTNIQIGNHCQFNLQTSIGHDCKIGDYVTCAPKVSISGNCTIGNRVYIGTGAVIKEKVSICDDVIIGALSFVNRDITEPGTYVGTPARKIK